MTLIAEIWITHPDVPLADLLADGTERTVRLAYQTAAEPDDRFLFLRVPSEDLEAFERALEADHTVRNPRLVALFADHVVYRVEVDTAIEVVPSRCTALGAEVLEVRSDGDGWTVRMHLLTRDALDAFREYCRERGVTYKIRELANVDSVEDEYSYGLTESQRTTLLLAYNAGYFEIPRRISQAELASELGISKSAVSQRLRRATADLVDNTLASETR